MTLPSNSDRLVASLSDQIAGYQMALRVVRELIDEGPGNAAQLAERMTDKGEDGERFAEEHVEEAFGLLDQWSLLSLPDPDDEDGPVALWS